MNLQDLPTWLETPAFIYDEAIVKRQLGLVNQIRNATGCRLLYSVKALNLPGLLDCMAPHLDGFAVSSLFEARLARSRLGPQGSIHLTTPGLQPRETAELGDLCDYVAFNSLSQWYNHYGQLGRQTSCGLRVNPGLSFLEDARYDPCRPDSKLGVPLDDLIGHLARDPASLDGLAGLLVHNNCEATDFGELAETVAVIVEPLSNLLGRLDWLNLGGGYLFDPDTDWTPLRRTVASLQRNYGLSVFLEPGAGLVRSAGFLIATVLDVLDRGGETLAVLDTTVNHMPETLEFDFEPDVLGHDDRGQWRYTLAGRTCLAGDLFGEYRFHQPLTAGDRVVFPNAGAYTIVKAHYFNGVNLPAIYALTEDGSLELKVRYTYAHYAEHWGVNVVNPV